MENLIDAVYIDVFDGVVCQVVEKADEDMWYALPVSMRGGLRKVNETFIQLCLDKIGESLEKYQPYKDVINPQAKTVITLERKQIGFGLGAPYYWVIVVCDSNGKILSKVMDVDLHKAFSALTAEEV